MRTGCRSRRDDAVRQDVQKEPVMTSTLPIGGWRRGSRSRYRLWLRRRNRIDGAPPVRDVWQCTRSARTIHALAFGLLILHATLRASFAGYLTAVAGVGDAVCCYNTATQSMSGLLIVAAALTSVVVRSRLS